MTEEQHADVTYFAEWLLAIGDGNVGICDQEDPENCSRVTIPERHCIADNENGQMEMMQFIYDNETLLNPSAENL